MPTAGRASRLGARLQLVAALISIALGEIFIFWRWRPLTDYYFLLVWLGYILLVDYLVYRRSGRSLLRHSPGRFLVMFPVSSLFWWVFEFYNEYVQNWHYLGSAEYQGLSYALVASLFFSTVLPAVWETAELLLTFLPASGQAQRATGGRSDAVSLSLLSVAAAPTRPLTPSQPPVWLPALGLVLSPLPVLAPTIAFPLVWVGLFLLLDPLNARAGRPSILVLLTRGNWQVPAAFYVGTTITGFFWEFWNYWAWPKWIYTLHPAVEAFPRLFEMPLPGYLGYGPFGWELFAMWWLVVGVGSSVFGFRRPATESPASTPEPQSPTTKDRGQSWTT